MIFPKITVVTPSYNQGKYLEETILSVIDQKYPNLEYIIIDGGSTDHSIEIIKKYENHLTYWISEKDSGMYNAIQKGFEKSTGEIMAWLNSDDMYHKKCLFTIAEIFQNNPSVKWIQGNPTTYDEQGRTIAVKHLRQWSKYNFYLNDYQWIQQESTFWKRGLWQLAGGYIDQTLNYASDFELWVRFFRYEKLYVTEALVGGFRVRTGNQLSLDNQQQYIAEAQACIDKELLNKSEQKIIKKIKFYQRLMKVTNRFKIDFLRYRYIGLFDYPAKITFDRKNQQFEIKINR